MRIDGRAWSSRTATVSSAPLTNFSAITARPSPFARRYALTTCAGCLTIVTPTLEPSVAGLITNGNLNFFAAALASASLASPMNGAVGSFSASHTRLAVILFIFTAEPATSEPVYGMPCSSSAACTVPSSPPGPCRITKARSKPCARSPSTFSRVASTPIASTLRLTSAASTASPLHSDTWRSADQPPISTATRPNSRGSFTRLRTVTCLREVIPHHTHFGHQLDAGPVLDHALHVQDQRL